MKKEAFIKDEVPRTPPKVEIEIEGETRSPTVKVEVKLEESIMRDEQGNNSIKAETDTVTVIKSESPTKPAGW